MNGPIQAVGELPFGTLRETQPVTGAFGTVSLCVTVAVMVDTVFRTYVIGRTMVPERSIHDSKAGARARTPVTTECATLERKSSPRGPDETCKCYRKRTSRDSRLPAYFILHALISTFMSHLGSVADVNIEGCGRIGCTDGDRGFRICERSIAARSSQ